METMQIPEIANGTLKEYLTNKNEHSPRYKSYLYQAFIYDNGDSTIWVDNHHKVNIGDDFRDYRGRLHIITEIVEEKPHKVNTGQKVVRVKSVVIPNV